MNFRILRPARLGSAAKLFAVGAVAAACLFGGAVQAQSSSAPAGSASAGKIGVLSVRQAIASTAEGKQAGAELQSQFASRQNELESLNKQIADLRQRLDAGGAKLSQDEQARLQREGQRLTTQLDRKQNEYQEDVNAAQADVFDRIGRKMMDVLDRYARENGYVAILDSSAQNTPILFASTNIDVTQEIVHLYDQAYPVKSGGASTSAPATPRSTTPKPTTPPAQKPPQQ